MSGTYCDFIVIYLARSEVPETHPRDSAIAALLSVAPRLVAQLAPVDLTCPTTTPSTRLGHRAHIVGLPSPLRSFGADVVAKFSDASIALLWIPADMIRH